MQDFPKQFVPIDSEVRRRLISEATWQMDPLLDALVCALESGMDMDRFEWLCKGMLPRLQQLNFGIMSMAGDENATHEELQQHLKLA